MTDDRSLSPEEYAALSDQKAQDWRSISEVNPTLFGVAGAIFAAGVAQHQAFVVALAPVPLFLGIWHMVRHARLQLQMITYLATHPGSGASWEQDVAVVRRRFWERHRRAGPSWLHDANGQLPAWLSRLMRPSAWNTWLTIAVLVALVDNLIPLFSGYGNWGWALLVGITVSAALAAVIVWQSARIEPERDEWTQLWNDYIAEQSKG
jgi:hypothetical protein